MSSFTFNQFLETPRDEATTRAVKIVCERVSYLLVPKTNLPVGPARCHRYKFLHMVMLYFILTYKVHLSQMAVCGV